MNNNQVTKSIPDVLNQDWFSLWLVTQLDKRSGAGVKKML